MGFSDAESKINNFHQLDDIYKSAVHSESQLAVFKSQEEQDKHTAAYYHMLKEMGVFLKDNGFQWEQETRCFNRIYFSPTGNVDYFLFQFPPNSLSEDKQNEFAALVEEFISDYTFGVSAKEKFSQCSPVKYK